jgi:hypothetical protein
MVWQDLVITIAVFLISYALFPQIKMGFNSKKQLISLQTSAITAVFSYVISFTYLTLNLYLSSAMSFCSGILWTILLVQSIIYGGKEKSEPELRPKYLEKLKKIRKGKYTQFKSIEDLRKKSK